MKLWNPDVPWRQAEAHPEEHPEFHAVGGFDSFEPSQSQTIPESLTEKYLKKMEEAKRSGEPNAFQKVWDEMPEHVKKAILSM